MGSIATSFNGLQRLEKIVDRVRRSIPTSCDNGAETTLHAYALVEGLLLTLDDSFEGASGDGARMHDEGHRLVSLSALIIEVCGTVLLRPSPPPVLWADAEGTRPRASLVDRATSIYLCMDVESDGFKTEFPAAAKAWSQLCALKELLKQKAETKA